MILITGATGFIGRNLIKRLKNKVDIRILTRDENKALSLFKDIDIVKGDILSENAIKKALKDIDIIVHLAGLVSYSNSENILKTNYIGTKKLLKYCKHKRFIFSSSVSVYGPIKGVADENYPINPTNPYGKSKAMAEKVVMNSNTEWIIFRIAPVYGIGSPLWLKNLKLLDNGFPVPKTENLTHIVHINDVVQAFEVGLEKGEGIYNIAGIKPIRFLDLVCYIMKLLGKKPRIWPPWLVKFIAKLMGMGCYLDVLTTNRHYSIKKAKEFGFKPYVSLNKGIKEMIRWYKSIII